MIYDWTQIGPKEITNLFLYGTTTTPTDLESSARIRPVADRGHIQVYVDSFMQTGPGRFALAPQSKLVEAFFGSDTDLSWMVPGQEYTKLDFRTQLRSRGYDVERIAIDLKHILLDDFSDDYLERGFIWNSESFQLYDTCRFVIDADGTKHIRNFALVPVPGENFDLVSSGGVGEVANDYSKPRINPWDTARTVDIEFVGWPTNMRDYTIEDYNYDVLKHLGHLAAGAAKAVSGPLGLYEIVDELWDEGVIKFIFNEKAIIYGSDNADSLSTSKIEEIPSTWPLREIGESNGVAIIAGKGNDTLEGGVHADYLAGNEGFDILDGGQGVDELYGHEDNDTLYGGSDNDYLDGGSGDDRMYGGDDSDTYIVDSTNDTVFEASDSGVDQVYSSVTYTLGDHVENLRLTGDSAINGTGNAIANIFLGNVENNRLDALEGDDWIDGGAGDDTMLGGDDNDIYIVDSTNDIIVEEINSGKDQVYSSVTYSLSDHVENLRLTGDSAINGTGNAIANYIQGNEANNRLQALDGDDSIDGGVGNDTMLGGDGDDDYRLDSVGDVVVEIQGEGKDTVFTSFSYVLGSEVECLVLGDGENVNGTGNDKDNEIWGNNRNNILKGEAGVDMLFGGEGNDTIEGGRLGDGLYGDEGNDVLYAGLADGTQYYDMDYLIGGTGYDYYYVGEYGVIRDEDGRGKVIGISGKLTGGAEVGEEGSNIFQSEDGNYRYFLDGNTLIVDSNLHIQNFSNGQLGIQLSPFVEEPEGPAGPRKPRPPKVPKPPRDTPRRDPLILDMDGDGIETVGMSSGVFFNFGADGFRELTGYVSKDDAFLAVDSNGDGKINNGGELFGDNYILSTGALALNGFEALKEFDTNHDGFVTSNDEDFEKLLLFKDSNLNGETDVGELFTLAEAGVASIDANYSNSSFVDANRNEHRQVGHYYKTNGERFAVADVWFNQDPGTTSEELIDVPLDVSILPDAVGFGQVHSLHQAMARDQSGELVSLVGNFLQAENFLERKDAVEKIIYQWTNQGDSYIQFHNAPIDFRKIGALESFYGAPVDKPIDAGQRFASNYELCFGFLMSGVYFQMASQSALKEFFDLVTWTVDAASDVWVGNYDRALDALLSHAERNKGVAADILSEFKYCVSGVDGNGSRNSTALNNAYISFVDSLDNSGFSDEILRLAGELVFTGNGFYGSSGNDTFSATRSGHFVAYGFDGDDIINALDTGSSIFGGQGNDQLVGGGGNDFLVGGAGADSLSSGSGADKLMGEDGNDYLAGEEDEDYLDGGGDNDTILGGQSNDTILGGAGDDVLSGENDNDLIKGGDGSDTLDGGNGNDNLIGNAGNDFLIGRDGNDSLAGDSGNDSVFGGNGNDRIAGDAGNDLIDGGEGNDSLYGGDGDDTYCFEAPLVSSNDSLEDNSGSTWLEFSGETLLSDLLVARVSDSASRVYYRNGSVDIANEALNRVVGVKTQNEENVTLGSLRVVFGGGYSSGDCNEFVVENAAELVPQVALSGTDTVYSTINYTIQAGVENLVLLNGWDAFTLHGNNGANRLQGNEKNNYLNGVDGSGVDTLAGGLGNDIYSVRFDRTQIVENAGEGVDTVYFYGDYYVLPDNVENAKLEDWLDDSELYGNSLNNTLIGNGVNQGLKSDYNQLHGEGGNDSIVGCEESRTLLDGGSGADIMTGLTGKDAFYVDNIEDIVVAKDVNSVGYRFSTNEINTHWVSDYETGTGKNYLYDSWDTVYSSINYQLSNNLETLVLLADGISGLGNSGGNLLIADKVNNGILSGGAGNDIYRANASTIVIEGENGGYDIVQYFQCGDEFQIQAAPNIEEIQLGAGSFNVIGSQQAEYIVGNGSINRIQGGLGNDTLAGGDEGDRYVLNLGDGVDTVIDDVSRWDRERNHIVFGNGISRDDLVYSMQNNDLYMLIRGTNDGLILQDWKGDSNQYSSLIFSDGLAVDLFSEVPASSLINTVEGTSSADHLFVRESGGYNVGKHVSSFAYGFDGDDTIEVTGNAVVVGGRGSDHLVSLGDSFDPSNNNETYAFARGDGHDIIHDLVGKNRIRFELGIALTDLGIQTEGQDYIISIGADQSVSLQGAANHLSNYEVQFSSGAIYELSDIANAINSGSINQLPYQVSPIATKIVPEFSSLSYSIPDGLFGDLQSGASLTYTASLEGGYDLPGWLSFDGRTFTGTVESATDIGVWTIKLTATDEQGNRVSSLFDIDAQNVNEAPIVVAEATPQLVVNTDESIEFSMTSLFTDRDFYFGDRLSYRITLSDGSSAPEWITVNSFEQLISNAPAGAVGSYDLKITATDLSGLNASTAFRIDLEGISTVNPWPVDLSGYSDLRIDIPSDQGVTNESLTGSSDADLINGLGGHDSLLGGEGNDLLNGGAGRDTLDGGSGDDILIGGTGNDQLNGGLGNDSMAGGAGDDTYTVDSLYDQLVEGISSGMDTVRSSVSFILADNFENLTLTGTGAINGTGNQLDNTITGNSGNNTLNGGAGSDKLLGGSGNDTYIVDSATDTVTENSNAGTDTVLSSASFTLSSNVENLTLTGVSAINGTGNTLGNILVGNSAANVLNGGGGNDTMTGGAGDDTYMVDSVSDVVNEIAGEGIDLIQSSVTYTLASNLEHLTLTGTTSVNGTGNAFSNILLGNSANNTLSGADGNDTLDGGAGSDTMLGGLGDDTYTVNISTDVVTENVGAGIDVVQSSVTYTLGSNLENLTLTGTSAVNGTGNTLANYILGNSGNNTLNGGAGSDTLVGGLGNDIYVVDVATDIVVEALNEGTDTINTSITLGALSENVEKLVLTGTAAINGTGNTLNNTITGNSGNNTLDGGIGSDTLIGGAGNDVYIVDSALDVITEASSAGTDTIQSSVTYTLASNVENLTLIGNNAINGTGNTLNNILTGNSANNTLDGGTGNDTMLGGAGNDTYVVNVTTDVVTENADGGTDTIMSAVTLTLGNNIENLTLTGTSIISGTGNTLNNALLGNGANNTLSGGSGNDTLDGGMGNDILIGGVGNDTYKFGRNYGADVLTENDATAGNSDVLLLQIDIARDQLWFRKVNSDLEVSIIGTSDKMTIGGWYNGNQTHVERFQTASGNVLLDSQVQNLVNAMAAFAPPAAGQTTLPQNYQNSLSGVIAANWS